MTFYNPPQVSQVRVSASPSHLISSSASYSAMWGEDRLVSTQDLLAREDVRGRGETLKISNLRNQQTTVVEVPATSPPLDIKSVYVLEDFVVLINACKARADADLLVFSIKARGVRVMLKLDIFQQILRP